MEPGQQVTPTIKLKRRLGQGAMGSVWVADHAGLGIEVAVKFVSPALASDAAVLQRFRREATAAANIKSPHVAQVFDNGVTEDGTLYIVMELLEGEDLKVRMRRMGPLDPREVTIIVRQVAKALTRAHNVGIVHRDIKPDNIFISDQDGDLFVKVLDFGIAKLSAEESLGMTATGAMVGTPLYMSPEQLLSAKHVDFRADLWSLAVVAYRALTGRPPFIGETLGGLSVAVYEGSFTPPSSLRRELPPAIDSYFLTALRRSADERFSSAREMADELERAVLGPGYIPRSSAPSLPNDAAASSLGATVAAPSSSPMTAPQQSWGSSAKAPVTTGSSPGAIAVASSLATGPASSDIIASSLAAQGHTLADTKPPRGGRMTAVVVAALAGLLVVGVSVLLMSRKPDASAITSAQTSVAPASPGTSAPPVAMPVPTTAEPTPPPTTSPVQATSAQASNDRTVKAGKPTPSTSLQPATPSASSKSRKKPGSTKDTIGF